jgi:hypothetical protein
MMSGTTNEFENPGGNYPDSGQDAAGVQAAEQRSDAGVGGAVHHEKDEPAPPAPGEAVQDEPVLPQNDASVEDKLAGIAAQTRVDLGDESHERYQQVIRQRLNDTGIELTDDQVSDLARRSSGGA